MQEYRKIYEDRWLLIVNKPQGILTAPFNPQDKDSLLQLLNKEYEKPLFPCHRLDKDTSGLVIFAKSKTIQKKIMGLFRSRKINKKYIGVVHGWIEKDNGTIKNYLFDGSDKKIAITNYRIILRKPEYTILEIEPFTGRKNQIRLHFKQIGHPIVGERKFVFARDYDLRTKKLLLHAVELKFPHPINGKELKLSSPIPEEIKKFFQ
ncbi:MAG: RluA family pseudouridine synthase [Candidatus Omnitrophica bacterium]|nr:RluA family pseudouridine synthase [Candidatus Omnitrophota bacterium]